MPRRRERRSQSVIGNVALASFALLGLWAIGLLRFVDAIPESATDADATTDAIVVLTGGSGRLDEGLELLSRDRARQLFVSGVYEGTDVRQLIEHSKKKPTDLETRISIGNAVNTRENAEETAAWMDKEGLKSLRLVTAAYHMPRSLLEFRHSMPEVDHLPNPVFPEHVMAARWWSYPGTAALFVSEYNKFLLAWVRQQAERFFWGKAPLKRGGAV